MAEPTDADFLYYADKFVRQVKRRERINKAIGVSVILFAIDAAAGSYAGFVVAGILALLYASRTQPRSTQLPPALTAWMRERRAARGGLPPPARP